VKTPGQRALSARHFVEHLPGPARPPRPDLSFSPVGFHAIRCIALTINFTRYFIRLPFAGSFDPGRRSSSSKKKKKNKLKTGDRGTYLTKGSSGTSLRLSVSVDSWHLAHPHHLRQEATRRPSGGSCISSDTHTG
jgi:hypothetical protein